MCKSRSNLGFSVHLIHLLELSLLIFCYVKEFESIWIVLGNKYFWLYKQNNLKLFRLLRYICYEESFQKICLFLTRVTKVNLDTVILPVHKINSYFLLLQIDFFLQHLCLLLLVDNYHILTTTLLEFEPWNLLTLLVL